MKTSSKVWIGVGVVALLFVFWVIGGYNSLVSSEAEYQGAWSIVESQYQRQADLIPNLVSVTASSVKAETTFVKDVVAARTAWTSASTLAQKDIAGQQMVQGVSAFVNAVAEQYPQFKANTQYVALTDELSGTQNRITTARNEYITAVKSFNVRVKRFPTNVLAGMFGFEVQAYYTSDSGTTTPSLGAGILP
jgi:LemA protein